MIPNEQVQCICETWQVCLGGQHLHLGQQEWGSVCGIPWTEVLNGSHYQMEMLSVVKTGLEALPRRMELFPEFGVPC